LARGDFLRALVAAFPDAMALIDRNGKIVAFSDSEKGMLGYDPNEVIGQNIAMLLPEAERSLHHSHIQRYLRLGDRRAGGYENLVRVQRKTGEIIPVDLSLHEAQIDGATMFIGFMHNATVREEQRQRLTQLSADLAHASRLSSMGLLSSAIAHDLNQPLTAIRNYVETVAVMAQDHGPLNRTLLARVMCACDREATRAGEIIRRLRQFISRGEAEHAGESLSALVTDAVTLARADGEGMGTQIDLSIPPSAEFVLVDGIQIQQVIFNLVRNALQAMTDTGERRICIWSIAREGMVEVVIEDSGAGITPEHEKQLFLPFCTKKIDGLGLGLSIVKMIVEAHGGRIWIGPSHLGGCAFHFTVPAMESTMEGCHERGSNGLSGR
jgi:two-component system, LuxR family, sensor kinase FixL